MSSETKVFLGIILATGVIIFGGVLWASRPAPKISAEVLIPANAWATGSATPKVTLVEFSDFQCPSCKAVEPIVDDLLKSYPDNLRFVFRYFPLQHPYSLKTAYVAEAAGLQGKFWQMRDLLFQNQDNLSDSLFPKLAQDLNLNIEKFNNDSNSQAVKDKVNSDYTTGTQIGINSTPTFYLNGQKLNLQTYSDLEKLVSDALK
jgi:protein-disulfide isomerase